MLDNFQKGDKYLCCDKMTLFVLINDKMTFAFTESQQKVGKIVMEQQLIYISKNNGIDENSLTHKSTAWKLNLKNNCFITTI